MRNVLQVKVTNNNSFDIEDRYDGILYSFKKGKSVSVPYEAACHIFGVDFAPDASGHLNEALPAEMFKHLQKRWGWNRTSEIQESQKRFAKLEFSLTRHVLVEEAVAQEESDELPAPHVIAKKAAGKNKEA